MTQPLDVGLFSPLQYHYGLAIEGFTLASGLSVEKEDFEPLLYQARQRPTRL